MGSHLAEPVQGAGGNGHPQLRQVAFQERADEFLAPLVTGHIRFRQEAPWKAAATPVSAQHGVVVLRRPHLRQEEGGQFEVADAAGQGFGTLAEQFRRGGPEHQQLAIPLAGVQHGAQHGKQLRCPLDFIQADQSSRVGGEKGLRVAQAGQVGRTFQIQVPRRGKAGQNLAGEGGLATLARPEDGHRRELAEPLLNPALKQTQKHLCRLKASLTICKSNPQISPAHHPPLPYPPVILIMALPSPGVPTWRRVALTPHFSGVPEQRRTLNRFNGLRDWEELIV